ncbi:MAG: hypothetical protein J2P41_22180 [Blastocatellia bacterium]|nr:hypothetical protein [Blastocatellia bacterium]
MLIKTGSARYLTVYLLALSLLMQIGMTAQAEKASERAAGRSQGRAALLTGTWRLEPSRSDNVDDAVERGIRELHGEEQQRARERLIRKLDPPDEIAIDQRGRRFTIVSTRAPKVSFNADGRTRSETTERGRNIKIYASLNQDNLTVSRTGSQGSDYKVTFDPVEGGQRLRITRSIFAEHFPHPIIVTSVYEKASDIAQLNLYAGDSEPRRSDRSDRPESSDRFIVKNDTRMTAVLTTPLSTREDSATNRFSLEVRSPDEYRGAIIDGIVSHIESSGRVSGRAELTLNFDRIRLRDGSTSDFRGDIERVRTPDGKEIKLENEGTIKEGGSQTTRTATRSGIGAALGAIIGAVAGGGSGAAIGAAVGAGAGAGTVLIQGRDNLDLPSGTEITLRASAPRNR